MLASCSYDRKIIVWKETSPNEFTPIYEHRAHELSINSIAWSPQEFGLSLACGSSDGYISVITHRGCAASLSSISVIVGDNTWEEKKFQAHQIGVNAVRLNQLKCCLLFSHTHQGVVGASSSRRVIADLSNFIHTAYP